MIKCLYGAALLSAALAGPAAAQLLTNGVGNGQATISVTPSGTFGSTNGNVATYNPVGPVAPSSTTFQSLVYARLGSAGPRTLLSGGAFTSAGTTSATSTLSALGIDFTLTQSLSSLMAGGVMTGSLLTQSYNFTNNTGSTQVVELTRYIDGDLLFDGSLVDGGGRLISGGREILFETDSATGSSEDSTFLGIFTEGGTQRGFEIDGFDVLRTRIADGEFLDLMIAGDGPDADQFIDAGGGYDVTLGLGRSFFVAAGGSATYLTGTIFGSGAPGAVVIPGGAIPEPATWATMLLGFGLAGFAVRRRRPAVAI